MSATEQQADRAIAVLKRWIDAAENSNQHGEDMVVCAAAGRDLLAALRDLLGNAVDRPLNDDDGRCCHCGRDNSEHLDEPCSDDCPGEIARAAIAKAEGR